MTLQLPPPNGWLGKRGWIVLAASAVVLSGCGSDEPAAPTPNGSQPTLVSSGLHLAGGSGQDSVVADGAGMAWVDGPWQVSRVDPASGEATSWDAVDDPAFAGVERLAGASGAGVWLMADDRLRLFDGNGFLRDLTVPEQYRSDDQRPQGELVQIGDEVWLAGDGGVGRWKDGSWSEVGELTNAGPLAVDTEGRAWAGSVADTGEPDGLVSQWDGQSWVTQQDAPEGTITSIAADPEGGVWVMSGSDEAEDMGVFHYDGSDWRRVGPGGYGHDLSVTPDGQVWAMVSAADAGEQAAGEVVAARLDDQGRWDTTNVQEDEPTSDDTWSSLAVAGSTPVLTTATQLWRWTGSAFESFWTDPAATVAPGVTILASSADDVWIDAQRPSSDEGTVAWGMSRWQGSTWSPAGPATMVPFPQVPPFPATRAADGAIWVMSLTGLVRTTGDQEQVVAELAEPMPVTLAPRGSDGVWLIHRGGVVGIGPDGTRQELGRPPGTDELLTEGPLAASGEKVWVGNVDQDLAAWDGNAWSLVRLPEDSQSVVSLLGAPDGALWAILAGEEVDEVALARLGEGTWKTTPAQVRGLVAGPDGTVCTARAGGDLGCYDASLAAVRTAPVGTWVAAFDISPDGDVWVLDEQVARLPAGALG